MVAGSRRVMLASMHATEHESGMPVLCALQYAVGRVEDCPGGACPFWVAEHGEAGCVLADVASEIAPRPSVAQHLLELRHALDGARPGREPQERSLFYRLRNEEQPAEGRESA